MNAIARKPFQPVLKRRAVLAALGLPWRTLWDTARRTIKWRMVEARARGDEEELRRLSQSRTFLRKRLPRQCSKCGVLVKGRSTCATCGRRPPVQRERPPRKAARKRRTGLRGEKHPNAKLSWAKLATARELRAQGMTLRVIAERFGVNAATLGKALNGVTWKAVKEQDNEGSGG